MGCELFTNCLTEFAPLLKVSWSDFLRTCHVSLGTFLEVEYILLVEVGIYFCLSYELRVTNYKLNRNV